MPDNFKEALDALHTHKVDIEVEEIDIKHDKVESEDIKMSTEEKDKIKALEKGEGKKSGDSDGDIEKTLKSLDSKFKGFKGDPPKKLTVEFEGWGDKKIDAKKQEMSMGEFVNNMKSKDWKKIRFQYDGKYPTDLHTGGSYVRLKAVNESAVLSYREWIAV